MTDLSVLRSQFPALSQTDDGRPRIHLDNPAGTQVPESVLQAIRDYLVNHNANAHGFFRTSQRSDVVLEYAHQAMADFLNAPSADEIIFGANMTTLTFALSRALAHWIKPGHEIVVTHLDHDANVSPWLRVAEDTGAVIRWLDFDPDDCTLRLDELKGLLSDKTFLVAVGYASNLVGTINPVQEIIQQAHTVGALTFIDAVHYAPHGPINVQSLGADFLICSPYKFFGPHQGVLWGKRELLERLPAYRVRPAGAELPGKFETGTQNHECMAGSLAAVNYLNSIGERFGASIETSEVIGRRRQLDRAMALIQAYERNLSRQLIEGLQAIDGIRIHGITETAQLHERVPTVSFTSDRHSPQAIAEQLAAQNIYVWDGHSYAVEVIDRLGLQNTGGVVRVGAVHYNTVKEIERFLACISHLMGSNNN